MRSAYGAVLRGAGGNPVSVERAGWSLLRVKMVMFALAGLFGVFAGLSLVGLTTSGDANIALALHAAVGRRRHPRRRRVHRRARVAGRRRHRRHDADAGGSFLSFLRLDPDWQIGAQGIILIVVLALRVVINRTEARAA